MRMGPIVGLLFRHALASALLSSNLCANPQPGKGGTEMTLKVSSATAAPASEPSDFGTHDANDDGHLSKREFEDMDSGPAGDASASAAFSCLDLDGNVLVTAQEMASALKKFYRSKLSILSTEELELWLCTEACVPANITAVVVEPIRLLSVTGLALWEIGVKNPYKLNEYLHLSSEIQREIVTQAICREIEGFGCLEKMPKDFTPKQWLIEVVRRSPDFLGSDGADGRLSREEFKEASGSSATFACLDTDDNGYISAKEVAELKAQFYRSKVAGLTTEEVIGWLEEDTCVPGNYHDHIAAFRSAEVNGAMLWELAVKNAQNLEVRLGIRSENTRETIAQAICREIAGLGCLDKFQGGNFLKSLRATETATSDADGDGLISGGEFQKLGTKTTFVCLDADANGYVSPVEVTALKNKFFASRLSDLTPKQVVAWLSVENCVPVNFTNHIDSFERNQVTGLSLWDLAVKNPHKLEHKLNITNPIMRETIAQAICREIQSRGCLDKVPRGMKVEDWLSSDEARVPLSDSNGDGKLSEVEFRTDTPFGAATFACLDDNQNGFISPDEIQRFKGDFYSSKVAKLDPSGVADWLEQCVLRDSQQKTVYAERIKKMDMAGLNLWELVIKNPQRMKQQLQIQSDIHCDRIAQAICREIAGLGCLSEASRSSVLVLLSGLTALDLVVAAVVISIASFGWLWPPSFWLEVRRENGEEGREEGQEEGPEKGQEEGQEERQEPVRSVSRPAHCYKHGM